MDDITIDARRQELLEARFLGNAKGQSGSESNLSTGSSFGAGPSSDRENDSVGGYPSTPETHEKQDGRKSRKRKGENLDQSGKKQVSGSTNIKKINEYFEPTTSPARNNYGLSEKSITSPSHIRSSPSSRHGNNSSSHIDISGLVHFQQKHC
uniref:Uncharacterized protein n=1 Tax=Ciona savignyi TaxID=51511 RepID=H2YPS8_CIOSA